MCSTRAPHKVSATGTNKTRAAESFQDLAIEARHRLVSVIEVCSTEYQGLSGLSRQGHREGCLLVLDKPIITLECPVIYSIDTSQIREVITRLAKLINLLELTFQIPFVNILLSCARDCSFKTLSKVKWKKMYRSHYCYQNYMRWIWMQS